MLAMFDSILFFVVQIKSKSCILYKLSESIFLRSQFYFTSSGWNVNVLFLFHLKWCICAQLVSTEELCFVYNFWTVLSVLFHPSLN